MFRWTTPFLIRVRHSGRKILTLDEKLCVLCERLSVLLRGIDRQFIKRRVYRVFAESGGERTLGKIYGKNNQMRPDSGA